MTGRLPAFMLRPDVERVEEITGCSPGRCSPQEHPRRGEAWIALRRVHADEAHNCVLLGKQVQAARRRLHATGDFLGKLLRVEGRRRALSSLRKGSAGR